MSIEGTQQSTGSPAGAVTAGGLSEKSLSSESSHKELVLLDDLKTDASARPAVPAPPGDTQPPAPSKDAKPAEPSKDANAAEPVKDAKAASSDQGNSPPQDAKPQANTKPAAKGAPANQPGADKAPTPAPRPVSQAKVRMQERLPAMADDAEVGQEKEQTAARDGKADLGFTGTLLGSAASSAPKGQWQEFRVYSTSSGKHVFSKALRTIFADENDKHEADVFDPSPASVPSQLLRSAREIARSRPMTWMDAAVAFFGYDPLAKVLYRKLSVDFEERV